jgi:hypothetical protein
MLLCESKDEILARVPGEQPRYANPALSAYSYLDDVGTDERSDPHYFGASIARHILSCPGQKLATHTFSHYYCLEPGQTEDQFAADIDAALKVLNGFHQRCVSITFPRNQYSGHHLNICHRAGLRVFRGNETNPNYAPLCRRQAFDIRRRGYRLMDAYYDLSGQNVSEPEIDPGRLVDVPSSRFLRPWNARLRFFEGSRLARIRNAIPLQRQVKRCFTSGGIPTTLV